LFFYIATFFQNSVERIPQHVTTTFFLDMCSAGDMMKNACKGNNFGGKAIVFWACQCSQEIEDGRLMQRILTPIVGAEQKRLQTMKCSWKLKTITKKPING
jgi:G:T-mismatch repair DNA endonuclease (very short patch repair protein)